MPKVSWFPWFACCLLTLNSQGALAQQSLDMESSIAEIANELLDNRRHEDIVGKTIGIPAFRHSDGSCSDLGNLYADKVLNRLFQQNRLESLMRPQHLLM